MTDIYESVKNAKAIGIAAHIRPDGDAIGACLAMYFYLKKRMPEAYIKIFLEKPDKSFSTVPGIDTINDEAPLVKEFDSFIMLDTVRSRIGVALDYYNNAKHTINIDHHVSNIKGDGDENYIDPDASATCEIVYELLDKEHIDRDIALCLYMGIAHDTGVFRFSNVSPKTFRICADLIQYGFDFSRLLDVTFFEKTYKQNLVQGQIVLDSKLYYEGLLIIGSADFDLMERFGVTKEDFDGVVNQLLLTKGVEVAAFMYEKPDGIFKISLRACTDRVDVSKISVQLGGGGHVRAAGVDFKGDKNQAIDTIIRFVGEQI